MSQTNDNNSKLISFGSQLDVKLLDEEVKVENFRNPQIYPYSAPQWNSGIEFDKKSISPTSEDVGLEGRLPPPLQDISQKTLSTPSRLSIRPRLSIYQTLKDKLTDVKDVNWEEDGKDRAVIVGQVSPVSSDPADNLKDSTSSISGSMAKKQKNMKTTTSPYPSNKIKTSRYNLVSFLPLNLYEQFSKVSNIYFLITGLMQMIPQITNSGQIPTVYLPLLFIICVAGLKDILEDLKRQASDKDENQQLIKKAVRIDNDSGHFDSQKQDNKVYPQNRLSLGQVCKFEEVFSEELLVGNIIRIKKNQQIPCDLLILRCSDAKGECFVETKNLDGETNLKAKCISKPVLNQIYSSDHSLMSKKVIVRYEAPNPLLYKFSGNIQVLDQITGEGRGNKLSLDEKNVLLKGCVLRNSEWIYGLVIYTGHETKIMLNSHTPDIKQSSVERKMSKYILAVCVLQIVVCLFSAVYYVVWYAINSDNLPYLYLTSDDIEKQPVLNFFVSSGVWLISLLNFVPIALLVTLEMVRFFQAIVICKEERMRSFNGFQPTVQSSNLNEDLGQIECIFSDKTGTLTCNVMNFKCLYVNGISYGVMEDSSFNNQIDNQGNQKDDKNLNKIESKDSNKDEDTKKDVNIQEKTFPNVNFQDERFFQLLQSGESNCKEQQSLVQTTLIHLSLCHSVILSSKESEEECISESSSNQPFQREYQAASPDDLALVNFAKYSGYEFQGTDENDIITIRRHEKPYYMKEPNTIERDQKIDGDISCFMDSSPGSKDSQGLQFEIYHSFEFNSDRKRMSLIVRDIQSNKLLLLTKGADSIILKRLDSKHYRSSTGQQEIKELSKQLDHYASKGLRVLVLASKELSESEFEEWDYNYKKAASALQNREEKIAALQDQMEQELFVVAATAIEDRLQDQVPETIQALKEAGILFWILTGDKKETAINIGLSTGVLEQDDQIIAIEIDQNQKENTLERQIDQAIKELNHNKEISNLKKLKNILDNKNNTNSCLVITGETLAVILESQQLSDNLATLCGLCRSVIGCRVSPKQKKEVVELFKNSSFGAGKRTLAIGDGANDVNMIAAAHVGIGIKGLEGMQAARSSDYSIGEFKILRRLLFFHGRECYRRNSVVILFNFYKNCMYLSPLIFFGFNSGFSGSNIDDVYLFQLYNAMFTAFPIMIYAVLDKNLSSKVLEKSPHLYKTGMQGVFINGFEFFVWILQGFIDAAVAYYFCMYSLDSIIDIYHMADLTQIGQIIFMLTVFIANLKVVMHTNTGYSLGVIIQVLSILVLFLLELAASYIVDYDLFNILARIFMSPLSYLVVILVLCGTVFFDYAIVLYKDFNYFMKLADELKFRLSQGPSASIEKDLEVLLKQEHPNIDDIRHTLKEDYPEELVKHKSSQNEGNQRASVVYERQEEGL